MPGVDTPSVSTPSTSKKRGRPAAGGPVVAGTRNGQGIGWCDGQFAGDAAVLADARAAISAGRRIWLGRAVRAGTSSPAEATAALLAAGVTVVQAPAELLTAANVWRTGRVSN